MKKRLFLVNYSFTTGGHEYNNSRHVTMKFDKSMDDEQGRKIAEQGFTDWYNSQGYDGVLDSVVASTALELMYYPASNTETSADIPFGWFSAEHRPRLDMDITDEYQHISDMVLIDIDGKRETFITGRWHSKPDGSSGWWQVDEYYSSAIDTGNLRWSYLPLAKYDK